MDKYNPSSTKTHISFLEACEKLLLEIDENKLMSCSKIMVNPLKYSNIKYQLDINDMSKKNIPDTILIADALCTLHNQYSEPEWTRVIESRVQETLMV